MHGGSAYIRSIGYDGLADTSSNNVGGFMMYSGSVQSQIGASEAYGMTSQGTGSAAQCLIYAKIDK